MGDDDALGVLALAIAHPVRGVDAARGGGDEGRGVTLRVRVDLVRDGEQPEEAIDAALGGKREVGEAAHAGSGIGLGGAGVVALVDERREQGIARSETRAEQLLGDGDALVLIAEVSDDAEQVARVGAGGQRADAALGLEDGDAVDDHVEGIARDGGAHVLLGIAQVKPREGVVEQGPNGRVLSSQERGARELLLLAALFERGARLIDLLGGVGLVARRRELTSSRWLRRGDARDRREIVKTVTRSMSIPCPPDRLWALFFDERYVRALYLEGLGFDDFRVIEMKEPSRKTAVKPKLTLPGPVARLIGDSFRYEDHATLDRERGVWSWQMVQPADVKNKPIVSTRGTIRIVDGGNGTSLRTDTAEVEARVFGVGGLIESSVEKELERSWDKELAFVTKWLARPA